ncbi:MAG: hypothetical protein WD557_08520 [Dehalococcoidia bacterium]
METESRPTVLCAWCGALIAKRGPMVSHGVCFHCLRAFEASALQAAPA